MTSVEWIDSARTHERVLTDLVEAYHPASRSQSTGFMPITAPSTELACTEIRHHIASEERNLAAPSVRLTAALSVGDVKAAMSLLQSTWFGVPESTDCWCIPGFSEVVALLSDPPDDIEFGEDE